MMCYYIVIDMIHLSMFVCVGVCECLSGERGSDFSLAVGVGAVVGPTDLQSDQHVAQIVHLFQLTPFDRGRTRGAVVDDVPGAGL